MDELDAPPDIIELRKAIDSPASCKASGSDIIQNLKLAKDSSLLEQLQQLLLQCWEEGNVPQDMRNAINHHPLQEQSREE